ERSQMAKQPPANYRKTRFPLLISVCLLLLASLPISLLAAPDNEIKKLIKQATELRRAGAFPEAEAALRKALDIEPDRSETKIELAYVLTKQRKLLDAYNLVLKAAEADNKNTRALAVLGLTLLTGGRFQEARAILYRAIEL